MRVLPKNRKILSSKEARALSDIRKALSQKLSGVNFRMILYGSKARGDADEHSDIDIAIIVDKMDRTLKGKILDIIYDMEIQYNTPVSALVISLEDHTKLIKLERRIALDIESEGIVL